MNGIADHMNKGANLRWVLLVLLAAILLAACDRHEDQGPIVARVGDAVLTAAELEARLPDDLDGDLAAAERAHTIETWVREELLYQEALARRLDQRAHLQQLLEQTRRGLLVADLLDTEFEGWEVKISESSIQQYYEQHRDEFLFFQPQVRARHILLRTLSDADARLRALQRGDSFGDQALQHSQDQDTRLSGGDLGYFSEEDDPLLWDLCQNLKLNSLSKPIRSESGYHIIQVLDRREAGTPKELDQARSQIVETLVRREHQQRLEDLITRLKAAREWAIHDRASEELP